MSTGSTVTVAARLVYAAYTAFPSHSAMTCQVPALSGLNESVNVPLDVDVTFLRVNVPSGSVMCNVMLTDMAGSIKPLIATPSPFLTVVGVKLTVIVVATLPTVKYTGFAKHESLSP